MHIVLTFSHFHGTHLYPLVFKFCFSGCSEHILNSFACFLFFFFFFCVFVAVSHPGWSSPGMLFPGIAMALPRAFLCQDNVCCGIIIILGMSWRCGCICLSQRKYYIMWAPSSALQAALVSGPLNAKISVIPVDLWHLSENRLGGCCLIKQVVTVLQTL